MFRHIFTNIFFFNVINVTFIQTFVSIISIRQNPLVTRKYFYLLGNCFHILLKISNSEYQFVQIISNVRQETTVHRKYKIFKQICYRI